jgi:hypothetical protein
MARSKAQLFEGLVEGDDVGLEVGGADETLGDVDGELEGPALDGSDVRSDEGLALLQLGLLEG